MRLLYRFLYRFIVTEAIINRLDKRFRLRRDVRPLRRIRKPARDKGSSSTTIIQSPYCPMRHDSSTGASSFAIKQSNGQWTRCAINPFDAENFSGGAPSLATPHNTYHIRVGIHRFCTYIYDECI